MANKANNIMELRPIMTKAKALAFIIEYVQIHGVPEKDAVVYTDNGAGSYDQWTFQGLCKLLIGE